MISCSCKTSAGRQAAGQHGMVLVRLPGHPLGAGSGSLVSHEALCLIIHGMYTSSLEPGHF